MERAHAPSQYALAKILADGLREDEGLESVEDGEAAVVDDLVADAGDGVGRRRRRRGSSHPDAVLALELYTKAARGAVLPALNNVRS